MSSKGNILVVGSENSTPAPLQQALQDLDLEPHFRDIGGAISDEALLKHIDAAVLESKQLESIAEDALTGFLKQLEQLSVSLMVFGGGDEPRDNKIWSHLLQSHPDESLEMVKGRLATLVELHPILKQVKQDKQRLDQLSRPLNSYMNEVDEEMRLAARLQRDFLPRHLPEVDGLHFATIYRPATWVSGDIYDITRLDESHIGFYVVDAVGHGMPAALMTMFIKRSIVTKNIRGRDYELIDPAEVLEKLNADLIEQELSNFQFATGCYAILNTQTLQLQIANAGHPPPLLIENSESDELDISGSLLGVFPEAKYQTQTFQLHKGQKLLAFSDGVEVAFINEGPDKPLRFRQEFGDLAHCDIQTMCDKLMAVINTEEGSLHPRDDVTILGIELTK
jgi:serine phosphatase RsbU (regulator of sigma subunit)